jgi:hypothetical protein
VAERQVVGVRLGAGVLIALAVGAEAAGPWVLAGIALAGMLALGSLWTVQSGHSAGNATGNATGSVAGRAVGAAADLGRVVVFASAFGAYLLPGKPGLAAPALVAGVVAADLVRVRLPDELCRWITITLVLTAAVLVGLCVAISPVRLAGANGAPSVTGVLLATAIMLPLLVPDRRERGVRRVCGSTAVALAVAGAALYQLGPKRLGLSPTPLLDVLAAADASAVAPLLIVVVLLATVTAALTTFTEATTRLADAAARERRSTTVACGVVTAAMAALAGPAIALVLAGALTSAELFISLATRYSKRRA